ncbi:MAG: lactonase family protein [Gammaproteobacteria bacterium]
MNNLIKSTLIVFCLASLLPSIGFSAAEHDRYAQKAPLETVYTLSNDANGNEVLAFQRYDHQMQPAGRFATGGKGTSSGLGNQGALALSKSGRFLFAVNPGSDDVSVFRIDKFGLELVDRAADEGQTPVSITVSHNRVFVANAGDDSIFGFKFDPYAGKLTPLPESYRKLSAEGTAPAQISFDHEGDALVITEKDTNKITTFTLNEDGMPEARHVINSAGITPFGFAFGKRSQFFVSEAQGGAANGATASSYELMQDGTVQLIDGAVAVDQTAACWLATTPDGRLAFTANTPDDSISTFAIDSSGHLSLLHNRAAEESRPRDLAISGDGRLLYTLSAGDNSIGVYRIRRSGTLEKRESLDNLPTAATGLVVR